MSNLTDEELRLLDLFRQKAADRRLDLAMRMVEQADEEHKRRHKIAQRKDEEERQLREVIATTEQLAAFDERLDDYDTATVHALMDNQHALDLVFKQREEMEASAYRLPDGRMAFRTEDGKRVFDQRGVQLGPETVHPDAIPANAPTWETKLKIDAAADKLVHERDELHAYQRHLDEARETAGKGDVTADALAKMDAKLRQTMPDAVKTHLPVGAAEPDLAKLPELSSLSAGSPKPQAFLPAGP